MTTVFWETNMPSSMNEVFVVNSHKSCFTFILPLLGFVMNTRMSGPEKLILHS